MTTPNRVLKLEALGRERSGRSQVGRPPKPQVWENELRRLCAEGTKSVKEIAAALGLPQSTVRRKILMLGLTRPKVKPRISVWTPERIALLRQRHLEGESFETIALACGVSESSVKNKVYTLGQRRGWTPWPDERVAELRRLRIEGKTNREIALALGLPLHVISSKIRSERANQRPP